MLGLIGSLFSSGGGIPWKLISAGVGAIAIAAAIWIHLAGDRAATNKITELRAINSQLEVDKAKLIVAIDRLKDFNENILDQQRLINKEVEGLRQKDEDAQKTIFAFKQKITAADRENRVKIILSKKKTSLLLRLANAQSKCQWFHFDSFDGRCSANGKWVKNEVK